MNLEWLIRLSAIFKELLRKPGAIRETLKKYVDEGYSE